MDGVTLNREGTLESFVELLLVLEQRHWGLTKRLTQGHTQNQWWNWDSQPLGSKSSAFFLYTQRSEYNFQCLF